MEVVGQRIKELRKTANLKQQDLAEGIVTRSYISQIEKGMVQPSYDTLLKLAERLNCKVEDFYEEPKNQTFLLTETKRGIKYAEGQVESGQFELARKTLINLRMNEDNELSSYDLGVLSWVKGKIQEKTENWEEAAGYFQESIHHLNNTLHFREYIRSKDSLGYIYLQKEENVDAFNVLNQAYDELVQYQIGGVIKASLLINLGIVHGKLGEYYSAIRFLLEAQRINHATHTHFKAGHISMALGLCYRRLSRLNEAEEAYEQALKHFNIFGDTENMAGTYTNLGILYMHKQKYEKSIECLLMAIAHYEKIDAGEGLINAKIDLANAFLLNGQGEEASKRCYQVIAKANHPKYLGKAYKILGDIEMKQNVYPKALEYYHEAKAIYKKHGFIEEEKEVIAKVADTHVMLQDYENAANRYYQIR